MRSSPNRLLATAFGAVYLVLGLAGFAVTPGVPFFAAANGTLLLGLLQVNAAQNVVHLALGAVLLAVGLRSARAAKRANPVLGAVFLLVGLVGLFVTGSDANVFAFNGAANVLHFGTAIVLLAAGLGAEKNTIGTPTAPSTR